MDTIKRRIASVLKKIFHLDLPKVALRYKLLFGFSLLIIGICTIILLTRDHTFAVLTPKGVIAQKERRILFIALLLSTIVVIPVFSLTIGIVLRYRVGNKKAAYTPDWDSSRVLETIWWGIPIILIGILGVITWTSTHELDPFRPINSSVKPITIQVIALDWKWLFLYPEQGIATVNYFEAPVNTPINFKITSDAPMNSFWIPQLSGQIYSMAGMTTQLHIMADETGDYRGSSANISGRGFAGMRFSARIRSREDFDDWVYRTQISPNDFSTAEYVKLAVPSENTPQASYALRDENVYDTVMMKYMHPGHSSANESTTGSYK